MGRGVWEKGTGDGGSKIVLVTQRGGWECGGAK